MVGQHVPGRGNQQNNQHAGERPQPLPGSTLEQLPALANRYTSAAPIGKDGRDQAFQQQPGSDAGCHHPGPQARVRFLVPPRPAGAPTSRA